MKIISKSFLFFCLPGLFVVACKKDHGPVHSIALPVSDTLSSSVPTSPGLRIVPRQIGSGTAKITFSYNADAAISKIDYGDGSSTVLSYDASGKPESLARYKGTVLNGMSFFEIDTLGRLITAEHYAVTDNNYTFSGSYTLTYNLSGQPEMVIYSNSSGKVLDRQELVYTPSGNLEKEKGTLKNLLSDLDYDGQQGIFSHVRHALVLQMEKENTLFYSISNNIRIQSFPLAPSESQSFSYTYTKAGYPDQVTLLKGGHTTISDISYTQLD